MKPKSFFEGKADVKDVDVWFRVEDRSVFFLPYNTPMIVLREGVVEDALMINSEERFNELWDVLNKLFEKWNTE